MILAIVGICMLSVVVLYPFCQICEKDGFVMALKVYGATALTCGWVAVALWLIGRCHV